MSGSVSAGWCGDACWEASKSLLPNPTQEEIDKLRHTLESRSRMTEPTEKELARARQWFAARIPQCDVDCDGDLPGEPHAEGCKLHGTFGPTQFNIINLLAAYGAEIEREYERDL
jgi:hypothetical protein